MRKARWLAEWRNSERKPVFYHVISRVVDRRFAFGPEEKEKFRALIHLKEKFTGCRVASYCLMQPLPPPAGGAADGGGRIVGSRAFEERLSAIYSAAFVAGVAKELADGRTVIYENESGLAQAVAAIHKRFTYRMQDLGEFMKGLLQRFTQWFNRAHSKTGRLWEDRFKSVIVEDGVAAKTISAYNDLNPVRPGMVKDPADYSWCSHGEAIGGGSKGNGKTARAGLVRALRAHGGIGMNADLWAGGVSREYRQLLMAGAVGKSSKSVGRNGKTVTKTSRKGISKEEAERER